MYMYVCMIIYGDMFGFTLIYGIYVSQCIATIMSRCMFPKNWDGPLVGSCGDLTVCYWKWPSRNSEFSHTKW